jgi:xanthine permease XanP
MSDSELIYELEANPPAAEKFFAALQHVLASFVGIITPTLIIGGVLGLGDHIPYLISMALMVSGVGTIIQAKKPMNIGAGMICLQGTSFAFLSSVLAAGFVAKAQGGGPEEILAMIMGVCFLGAFIEIGLSQVLPQLKRLITPLVTGTVITIIGVSLIKVGMIDLAGGKFFLDRPELGVWGSLSNLGLGFLVLISIIILNRSSNQWLRLSSIVIGIVIGSVVAYMFGMVDTRNLFVVDENAFLGFLSIPMPFRYGFSFDFIAFIPIALIYVITAIESSGDITANCMISKQDVKGESYINRIKNGVLGDGVNSAIAAVFNTFPNTTFSQNNGVIQLTGIASRHVGVWIGIILVIMGLFPHIGSVLRAMPNSVLGGATIVMFGTVAIAGIKILATVNMNRRNMLILAVSFGMGIGVLLVPEFAGALATNIGGTFGKLMGSIFSSAITTGGLTVLLLSAIMGEKEAD